MRIFLNRFWAWVFGGMLCASGASFAVSFDCHQTRYDAEVLICMTPNLSELDDQLASIYSKVLSQIAPEDMGGVIKAHRAWQKQLRDLCTDASCLETEYQSRIWELIPLLPMRECENLAQTPVQHNACQRRQLENLEEELQVHYSALLRYFKNPKCCSAKKAKKLYDLVLQSQKNWKKYRQSECQGQYETYAHTPQRAQIYFSCAKMLLKDRIYQLQQWRK